jgi:hypothetical protein
MKYGYVGVVALAVLACAGTRGSGAHIQPFGPDRYIVTYSSMFGEGKAKHAAVRDANGFCADRQLVMEPIEESLSWNGEVTTFSLEFRCVAP